MDQKKKRFDAYDKLISDQFNEQYLGDSHLENDEEKPYISMREELAGENEVFQE